MLTRITTTALALGLLLSAGASAFDRPGALGPAGEVYLTRVGPYGVLFPKGNSYPAGNVVLTLEVSRSGGTADRILVPGTEGPEVESASFVVFEEASKSLFLLWQTSVSSVNRLVLRSFKNGSFGAPIEVTTGTFGAAMSAPQAAVTRDEFPVTLDDGETGTVHQTLLHLTWWQDSAAGSQVLYAPITLVEGIYTGWHPVYSLNDFDYSADDPAAAAEILPQLYQAPRIQTGRDDHSVIVSFANERNGRFVAFDVSVVPGEISVMADRLRSHMIEIGRRKPNVQTVAERLRSHMIEIGRLNPRVMSFLSNDVYEHVLVVGPQFVNAENYEGLADDVSTYVTQAATTLLENGRLGESPDSPEILRLAASGSDEIGAPRLQLRGVFNRPAPRTAAAPTTTFAAEDGKTILIAWDTVNQVRYRESSAEGWGDVLAVTLSEELTRKKAYDFLEQRLRR